MRRIERYTFVITGVTHPAVTRTLNSQTCNRLMALPSLGLYRVEVTVHTALGSSVTVPSVLRLRDYLIVSIGDSLASGEGAPDRLGSYGASLSIGFSGIDFETHTTRAVQWQDRRCHRSTRSGPAQAAKEIEDASQHTSVTFVSFACSGADIKHLNHVSYAGAEPPAAGISDLPPQIIAVRQLLDRRARGLALRQIDALLVTGGINDLSFSDIIKRCWINNNREDGHTSCVYGSDGAHLVNTLKFKHRYDELAASVRFWLPNARAKYINDYPRQVFKGGACGALGKHGPRGVFGIEHTEGEAMNVMGIALNRQVEGMTIRHAGEGWHYIGGVTAKFEPHAYCADFPWFNHVETSLAKQGDVDGTAHPNRAGHFFYSHLLRRAIVLGN